jgi:Tfp pilus assembly protein PilN
VTIVTSEARLGMTTAQMPRVNLLPPEIAEKALMRKVQVGLGTCVLAAVGVVGLLTVSAAHGVSSAQSSVTDASAKGASLQAQTAKYSNVTAVYNQARAAQAQLTTAMGAEVRYSQMMHDLSLVVPSSVWLKNLTYSQTPPSGGAAAAATTTTTAATATAAAPVGPIGTVSFQGIGFDHDDLALWLEAVAGLKTYTNVYFSNSSETLLGSRKTVNFSSSADITPAAYSGRYTKAGN